MIRLFGNDNKGLSWSVGGMFGGLVVGMTFNKHIWLDAIECWFLDRVWIDCRSNERGNKLYALSRHSWFRSQQETSRIKKVDAPPVVGGVAV